MKLLIALYALLAAGLVAYALAGVGNEWLITVAALPGAVYAGVLLIKYTQQQMNEWQPLVDAVIENWMRRR